MYVDQIPITLEEEVGASHEQIVGELAQRNDINMYEPWGGSFLQGAVLTPIPLSQRVAAGDYMPVIVDRSSKCGYQLTHRKASSERGRSTITTLVKIADFDPFVDPLPQFRGSYVQPDKTAGQLVVVKFDRIQIPGDTFQWHPWNFGARQGTEFANPDASVLCWTEMRLQPGATDKFFQSVVDYVRRATALNDHTAQDYARLRAI
jgi:hypothetical protein